MGLYQYKSRAEYLEEQVKRSKAKTEYCKVFFSDVIRYRQDLLEDGFAAKAGKEPSILCLGVRSGAEVDIFRTVFFGVLLKSKWFQARATHKDTSTAAEPKIKLARQLGLGSGRRNDGRVMGVELAPEISRPDVHIGSFDELPDEWNQRFNVLYSNSIDHSQDPKRTIREWKRVAAPGAYVILAFSSGWDPTPSDPFSITGFDQLKALWGAPVVFTNKTSKGGYSEICFRLL
ncbi:MAG: hypothetical protein KIS85_00030 [Anaerolineales bacterium]|nr:hypothetical protein [Anaerolineales bacterium]